jgi:hypothetical protein
MYTCDFFVHQKCYNHALINLWFGLSRSMCIIDPIVTRPTLHPEALAHLFTPKVLQGKEHTPIPYFNVFTFEFGFEYFKECGGASINL